MNNIENIKTELSKVFANAGFNLDFETEAADAGPENLKFTISKDGLTSGNFRISGSDMARIPMADLVKGFSCDAMKDFADRGVTVL